MTLWIFNHYHDLKFRPDLEVEAKEGNVGKQLQNTEIGARSQLVLQLYRKEMKTEAGRSAKNNGKNRNCSDLNSSGEKSKDVDRKAESYVDRCKENKKARKFG